MDDKGYNYVTHTKKDGYNQDVSKRTSLTAAGSTKVGEKFPSIITSLVRPNIPA